MTVTRRSAFAIWIWAVASLAVTATAQSPLGRTPMVPLHRADMVPGAVGQGQLLRGGPLPGYFQPVSLQAPQGAHIAIWAGDRYVPFDGSTPLVGMLIGQVYRLKITRIPGKPGAELYPTLELVNRLYPPPGLERKYPVPIVFSQEELEMALEGYFVTRVVYLENPNEALPVRDRKGEQRVVEVGHGEDPLQTADVLGRPVAIVRLGSRIPTRNELDPFGYGAPPYQVLPPVKEVSATARATGGSVERAIERSARVPRVPLSPTATRRQ